jgi:uncharacterized protein YcfL
MNHRNTILTISVVILMIASVMVMGCNAQSTPPVSDSGVQKASVQVQVQPNGMTVEQQNIADKIKADNTPGAIKHLYLISPFNNRVIYYSTVNGKVTSSGKRLTPNTVFAGTSNSWLQGIPVNIGGGEYRTGEVTQDDGTYGTSNEYLYWWDTKGIYHQVFSGQSIIVITSEPISINTGTTISIENT